MCAAPIPAGARFCPACGTAVESERVPVNVVRAEPRYFGVAPATLVLVLAFVALGAGIVLAATGNLLPGVLLAAAAAPLLFAFLTVARTHPDSRVARAVVRALDGLTSRLGMVVGIVSATARARHEMARARAELAALDEERAGRMLALADAAYRKDDDAVRTLRAELAALDEARGRKEADVAAIAADADARIRRAQLEAQPTQALDEPVADVRAPDESSPR